MIIVWILCGVLAFNVIVFGIMLAIHLYECREKVKK
jgi:hypothetical protein